MQRSRRPRSGFCNLLIPNETTDYTQTLVAIISRSKQSGEVVFLIATKRNTEIDECLYQSDLGFKQKMWSPLNYGAPPVLIGVGASYPCTWTQVRLDLIQTDPSWVRPNWHAGLMWCTLDVCDHPLDVLVCHISLLRMISLSW